MSHVSSTGKLMNRDSTSKEVIKKCSKFCLLINDAKSKETLMMYRLEVKSLKRQVYGENL